MVERRYANRLPAPVGAAFLRELVDLVDGLATDSGFKGRYLREELLSKYCDSTTTLPTVRRDAAITKWRHQEMIRNAKTNERIPFGVDFGWCHSDDIRAKARTIIAEVLGPISNVSSLFVSKHTNGASTRIRRSELAAICKHSGEAHATPAAALQWSMASLGTLLEDQEVSTVRGSVLFTVPKSSEIDRVACKEPEVNSFLQRGVGDHIRRRLRRYGIDLNDQSRNQELARQGQALGLATVDLSSASDSITRSLVMDLLPSDWWYYLDEIRCHTTMIGDEEVELQMFSSMGNGFTFELESLIFWALTRSVCSLSGVRGRISVYGDDIIAPSRIVPRLNRVFNWYGFRLNLKKTHWQGDFRESCGLHVHKGMDVTPFYVRRPVEEVTDLIRILNRLLEWSGRGWGFICDESVAVFHQKWSRLVPEDLWGGVDPDDITSLVSGHPPRGRFVPKAKNLRKEGLKLLGDEFDVCRYLRWHTLRLAETSKEVEVDVTRLGKGLIIPRSRAFGTTTWRPYLAFSEAS